MVLCVCVCVRVWGEGGSEHVLACILPCQACNALVQYGHMLPLWLHHIFRHYLINGTIFGKELLDIKYEF
jgi:hypothetical protein